MSEFLYVYHGGKHPETPEEGEQMMAKWQAWMDKHESQFTNPGNPVGMSKTVSAGGVADNGGSNPTSGFTIVSAKSIEEACEIAKGCPINDEGGSIEVAEIIEM